MSGWTTCIKTTRTSPHGSTPPTASFGRLRAALERPGKPIGPYDMLIAAQALSRGLVLVTDNVDEFGRIEGLQVENWRLA